MTIPYPSGYRSAEVAYPNRIALSSGQATDIASITLPPGEWMVWGTATFYQAAGTSLSQVIGWVSETTATEPVVPNGGAITRQSAAFVPAAHVLPIGVKHVQADAEIAVHLSCKAAFSGGPLSAYGFVGAMRAEGDSMALREWVAALVLASCQPQTTFTERLAGDEPYLERCVGTPETLVVHLHTWSADYKQVLTHPDLLALKDVCIVSPNAGGPVMNTVGSPDALDRIVRVIDQAKAEHHPRQVVVFGASGGGYLTLLLSARYSFDKALVWVPIYDLEAWHAERPLHRPELEAAIGHAPVANDPAYLARSPRGVLDGSMVRQAVVTVGQHDEETPPWHGREAAAHLLRAGVTVTLHERDMGHEYQEGPLTEQLRELIAR